MSTPHIVSIPFGDNVLQVHCNYTKGRPSNHYWEPDESDEIEIERIMIGQENVTELLAKMYVHNPAMVPTGYSFMSVWEDIEQRAMEEIYGREP